jgi:hypothetical protein
MRRRVPLVLFCLLLLLLAAHTAYWFWATRAVAAGFEQWAVDRRAGGWTVTAGPGTRGGWPLRASLTLPDAAMSGGEAVIPGGFSWRAGRVTLEISLLEPNRLEITPDGTQHIRIADAPDVGYAADRLVARFSLRDGVAPNATDIRGDGVRLDLPDAPGAARRIAISLLQAHVAWQAGAPVGEPAFSTALDATEITLPPGTRWPLGNRIAALSLDAALDGPVLSDPVPALADPRRQASQWRDGGGTVDVRRLSLGWGPLGLTARATLALDGQLQPAGTGVVRLVGYAEAADMLATTGALTRSAATAAKAVLGLLARVPEDGGAAEVELPLTLQDRTLAMRQFPLMRLPVLTWPDRRT